MRAYLVLVAAVLVGGCTGAAGTTSADAAVGPKGDPGSKGDTGSQGLPGPKGDTGPQGAKGDQGATGPKGDTGPQGATGPAGAQGIQGVKGDTGAQGTQGIQGPKGDTGQAGAAAPTINVYARDMTKLGYPVPTDVYISVAVLTHGVKGMPDGWVIASNKADLIEFDGANCTGNGYVGQSFASQVKNTLIWGGVDTRLWITSWRVVSFNAKSYTHGGVCSPYVQVDTGCALTDSGFTYDVANSLPWTIQ